MLEGVVLPLWLPRKKPNTLHLQPGFVAATEMPAPPFRWRWE